MGHAPRAEVSSMAKRGSGRELFSDDHRIAHRVITTHLDTECESTESTGSIDSMESVDSMESADPATLTSVG